MALKKLREFNTGQSGEYWKIVTFYPDLRSKMITSVYLGLYKDEQAKIDGKEYFYGETISIEIPYEVEGNNQEKCYEEIKKSIITTNEQGEDVENNWFADAENC